MPVSENYMIEVQRGKKKQGRDEKTFLFFFLRGFRQYDSVA